jgi:PAS domain S-box-containing protein
MSEGVALHNIIYNSDHKPVDYIITNVNPAYEKITGLNRSDAVGKRASELYGTGKPPYIEIYAPVADSGEPVQFETYFEHVDKDFRVSVVSHNKGKFATFFEDITQRKKAENARSELSSIVESSEDAIIGRNLDGRITSWNKGAERIYGYSTEDAVGRNISFLIPENYFDDTSLMTKKIKYGEKVYHQETKRIKRW